MNKKKQVVNKKHRKTKSRLKNLKDISLKLKKKTPLIKKNETEEVIEEVVEKKEVKASKSKTKKTPAKKAAKKAPAKKSKAKKK